MPPTKPSTLTAQKYQAAPSLARDIGGGTARKKKDYEEARGLPEPKEENPDSLSQNRGKPQKNSNENSGKDLQIGPVGVSPKGSLIAKFVSLEECSNPLAALLEADKTIQSNKRPTP